MHPKPRTPIRIVQRPIKPSKIDSRAIAWMTGDQNLRYSTIKERIDQKNFSEYSFPSEAEDGAIEDLAIIMANWGQSDLQVQVAQEGLEYMLEMIPSAHVYFIEAQWPNDPYRINTDFDGVTRMEVELSDKQRGMFLKEPLWNIAARHALENPAIKKLLFIDADCSYCYKGALQELSKTLDDCDVCSGHAYAYYVNQEEKQRLQESACTGYMNGNMSNGHPGFTIAMTRDFFNRIDGIPILSNVAGDTWFWFWLFGKKRRVMSRVHAPFNYGYVRSLGMVPFPKVSCVGEVLFHRWHGPIRHRVYNARRVISRATTTTIFEDRIINEHGLPEWKDTIPAKIAKECHIALSDLVAQDKVWNYAHAQARLLYNDIAEEHYGAITEEYPLVISTAFRGGGPYEPKHVIMLKNLFERFCKTPYKFICVSDVEIEGVDCRPFITDADTTPYYYSQLELFRADLYPENASVLTCDLDAMPVKDMVMHRCPENSISMGKELHNWHRSQRTLWNGGVCYFRGDFSFIINDFIEESKIEGPGHPFTTFISSQEFMAGNLYKHGIPISDLLAHLAFQFYDGRSDSPRAETVFMHFLSYPKPWEIHPKPEWLPDIAHSVGSASSTSR